MLEILRKNLDIYCDISGKYFVVKIIFYIFV